MASQTLLEVSLGVIHDADFDAGGDGYFASPPAPAHRPILATSWEHGTPTSGPGFAHSGSNVWATNLSGLYGPRECGAILSPPIDLSGASSAGVSFMQWRHLQQSTTGSRFANDAAMIFVTEDAGTTLAIAPPTPAFDGPVSDTSIRRCLDNLPASGPAISGPAGTSVPPAVWSPISIDLTPWAGRVVQVALAVATSSTTHYQGWYVDDFTVTRDGVPTVEDFEAGDGGFTVVSPHAMIQPLGWGHGIPVGGPAETTGVWATNPAGDYGHRECASLESPPFTVAASGVAIDDAMRATLHWDNWYRGNSLYSAGVVQVGTSTGYVTITPSTGYPTTMGTTYRDQLVACLGVDPAQRVFASTHDGIGAAMRPLAADLTPFLGEEVTIRFLFATAWSNLGPTLNWGWAVDDVVVDVDGHVQDLGLVATVSEIPVTASNRGWREGGAVSSWASGFATTGPVGELVLATNPDGNYNNNECSWVESPPIPGALLTANPNLVFEHWYKIYGSSSPGVAWSGGVVLASGDDGVTWDYLNLPEYGRTAQYSGFEGCLKTYVPGVAYPAGVFSGEPAVWETVAVDLSAYDGADTVKIRFLFGSGIAIFRDGWYLRSVELGGVKLL